MNQISITVTEQQDINEAFENFLESFLSDSINAIKERFGLRIATLVREIYDDAMDCPTVDWSSITMDRALDEMHLMLCAKYPWLSDRARANIN